MPAPILRLTAKRNARLPRIIVAFDDGTEMEVHPETVARHGLTVGFVPSGDALLLIQRTDEEIRCREAAWRLLAVKPRAVEELIRALQQRRFPATLARQTAEALAAKGFLDDVAFARQFTEERGRRREGPRLIEQGLRSRGIGREEARDAVAGGRGPEQLRADARALLEKWNRRSKPEDPRRRRQAAAGFLARRGYDAELVWEVVREVLGAASGEGEE